mgnify:FL=1|jgi:hypothetical protein
MTMFIEVDSYERGCKVIINLDSILEIAPLRDGGCTLFFPDSAAVGGKNSMRIKDSYAMFKQFVLQTVSEDDVARQVARLGGIQKESNDDVMERIARMSTDQKEKVDIGDEKREKRRIQQQARRATQKDTVAETDELLLNK